MGFKVDTSFLRFLTMGALASQRVMEAMGQAGLRPIELERYSSSNKIWMTKVKRLRLPDVLCVATGLRVEVRAKSGLAIRMSDAPANPQRRWFSGLDARDMVAFVHCKEENNDFILAQQPELFWVKDLQACRESQTRLGPPKSASEGSERDREWPTIVPKKDGVVLQLTPTAIKTRLVDGRAQTYQRRKLKPYVKPGDKFVGEAQFIAGLPDKKASLSEVKGWTWDPRHLLRGNEVDRYVAAKALGVTGSRADFPLLRKALEDADARVALEAAGALAKLGDRSGAAALATSVKEPREPYLRMETIFLLSELQGSPLASDAASVLSNVASDESLAGDEVRQAAIWGLGRAGLRTYQRLLPYLNADDENERIHAIVAFAPKLPDPLVGALIGILADQKSSERHRASSAYVLSKLTEADFAVRELIRLARDGAALSAAWAKAVLGSLPSDKTAHALHVSGLVEEIRPLQILSPEHNWTMAENAQTGINFVRKQTVLP